MARPLSIAAGMSVPEIAVRPLPSRPARRGRSPHVPVLERRDHASRDRLVQRLRSEFCEMPGLHLTLSQAMRLFDLRSDICSRVFASLVREGYLSCGDCGQYCRRDLLP